MFVDGSTRRDRHRRACVNLQKKKILPGHRVSGVSGHGFDIQPAPPEQTNYVV